MRDLLAVWAGRVALRASRRLGYGGSSLPGQVALRIQPAILRRLAGRLRRGAVLITGTNGKTTTAALLAAILEAAGWRLIHNRSGANLIHGLVSAFLEAPTAGRRAPHPDIALLEVDEATVPEAVRELRPVGVVVTNFSRDQLDRFGELDATVSLVARGLDALRGRGFVALNADDPLVAALGRGRPGRVIYYGVAEAPCRAAGEAETREQRHCPACGRELAYRSFYYGHLGRYECPGGDFARPASQVLAREVDLGGPAGASLTVNVEGHGEVPVVLPVPGLYNVYNGLAALTAALQLGVSLPNAAAALARARPCFGRMERIAIGGRELLLALVKNPTGFNQVLLTILGDRPSPGRPRRRFLIAVNDRYADGTDVSWLWDVEFELLARRESEIEGIVVSGLRALDMAVRLKYAGFPMSRVRCVPHLGEALDVAMASGTARGPLYVTPTYTAMLELRDILTRRGYTPPFWKAEETWS